jgi:DNA-binding NarL/FixJ family response regulator
MAQAAGKPTKAIAEELGVTEKCVSYHLAKFHQRTKTRCASDVTRWCIRHGYIQP